MKKILWKRITALLCFVSLVLAIPVQNVVADSTQGLDVSYSMDSTTGWTMTSRNISGAVETENNWAKNYQFSTSWFWNTDGIDGKYVSVTRNGTGYVSIDSELYEAEGNTIYMLEYALRVKNAIYDTFYGVRAYLVQYDAQQNQLQRTMLTTSPRENFDWTFYSYSGISHPDTAYIQIQFWCGGVQDSRFSASFDNVRLREVNDDVADIWSFERSNILGGTTGWEASHPEAVSGDTANFYNGQRSVRIAQNLQSSNFTLTGNVYIPVKTSTRYVFNIQAQSQNSQIKPDGIRLDLLTYDSTGKKLETIQGLRSDLSGGQWSDWTTLICGLNADSNIAYVRPQLVVAAGVMDVRVDALSWYTYDNNDYLENFENVTSAGAVAQWEYINETGTAQFDANGSTLSVTGGADVSGYASTNWYLNKQNAVYDMTVAYQAENAENVFLRIRFFDFANKELTEHQVNHALTSAQMTSEKFQFTIPSAMYAKIELGVQGVGCLRVDSLHLDMVQQLSIETAADDQKFTHTGDTQASFENINGTQTLVINGNPVPNMTYVLPSHPEFMDKNADQYMHESGICVTRVWTQIANEETGAVWIGPNQYNFNDVDDRIRMAIHNHPDTYLIVQIEMDVPQWWKDQNPDELIVSSEENGKKNNVSFASEKFANDAIEANMAMIDHIMKQDYANRIVGAMLTACSTSEWVWYDLGQYALDYSPASQNAFRTYLKDLYGTDAALQTAWNDPSVTLDTAVVPALEDRIGSTYASLLTPEENKSALDYHNFMADVNVKLLKRLAAAVTEKVEDRWVIGAYYGYINNTYYYGNSSGTMHIAVEQALEDENLDFFAAPVLYNERYDGQSAAYMQMIDSIQAHGKAVMIENDNRLCSYEQLSTNFFTRDSVGPTYTVSDSLSQIQRDFANQITTQVGQWWYNMWGNFFLNEQFSKQIGQMYDEVKINTQRPSDYQSDICYIIDEDLYTYLSYSSFYSNYDFLYSLLYEQRQELAKIGTTYDMYYMSDLEKGLIPDYKVYMIIGAAEMDDAERTAVNTYLKNNGKTVIWQYICGASDGTSFNAANMSNMIGMDVELVSDTRVLQAKFTNSGNALTNGAEGTYFGSTSGKNVVSPVAVITDTSATVLGTMVNTNEAAFAVKNMGNWTSIYSAVPCVPAQVLRNILEMNDVHIYCDDTDSVIFASDKYVAINCAYGGEKTITLPGNYSVYDVYRSTVISKNTESFTVDMENHSTRLFRLMSPDTHSVFVESGEGGKANPIGYNEYIAGSSVSIMFEADKGYTISSVQVNGVLQSVSGKKHTIILDNLNQSYQISAAFEKEPIEVYQPESITSDGFNGGFEEMSDNMPVNWTLTSMTIANKIDTTNNWKTNYTYSAVTDQNGNAVSLNKNGTGYVALTSSNVAVNARQGYRISYSYKTAKIEGLVDAADFYGVHTAVECLDSNGNSLENGWIVLNNTTAGYGSTISSKWNTVHHDFVPVEGTEQIRIYLCIGGKYYVKASVLFDDVSIKEYAADTIVNADFTGTVNATLGGRANTVVGPAAWSVMTTGSGGGWNSAGTNNYMSNYIVSTVTLDGDNVMKLAPVSTTKGYVVAYSHYIAVKGSTKYTLSYDQKIDLGEKDTDGAKLLFYYFDKDFNYLAMDWQRSSTDAHDWQRMENTVTTRAKTAYMIVGLFIGGKWNQNEGLAYYYDDLILEKHHTVRYVADGKTVATYFVRDGESVESIPDVPSKSGYIGSWNHNGENITADTVIEATYAENIFVKNWNLILGDCIGIKFYLQMTDEDAAKSTVSITVNDKTETAVLSKTTDGLYIASVEVAAAQMTDAITVQLTCGDYVLEKEYSVLTYAETILQGTYDDATKMLVREMLNYGAAAQRYFDYNMDKLIPEALYADAGKQSIPEDFNSDVLVAGRVEGISFYGASLLFTSKTAVRFYFAAQKTITNFTFTAGDKVIQPVEKNGLWYIEVDNIVPQELDVPITVVVNDGTNEIFVTYSPMHYIVRKYANGPDNLKALLQAMYNYHLAAKAYVSY